LAIEKLKEKVKDFPTNSAKDLNCLHSVTGLKRKTAKATDFAKRTATNSRTD
jgi:hypothetical protein